MIITGSNGDQFLSSVHGQQGCQECHGGAADSIFFTMGEAHTGMVADPSPGACEGCHEAETVANANSLHTNLWGEREAFELRAQMTLSGAGAEAHFEGKCGSCHTTCGQCHVSRPASVGGGFPKIGSYYAHRFRGTPDMNEQCTACHGSRVGTDYKGELEGNQPDVHRSMGFKCEACHTQEEIHGDGQYTGDHYTSRYEVATMPRCEDCHTIASNAYHDVHVDVAGRNLQCQVCHSQPYKNCSNCHDLSNEFTIDPSVVEFKIARNADPNRAEYDYAVVRHSPIDPGTYADWGVSLPGYLDAPTWSYASPHNVLRWAPQTSGRTCSGACHDSEIYLRESDLYANDGTTRLPDYLANIDIVMPPAPAPEASAANPRSKGREK